MTTRAPFDDLSAAALSERRSAKWSTYPPDVLPAWIAEMDFPLAAPIAAALRTAIDAGDLGYADPTPLAPAFAAYALRRWGWRVEEGDVAMVADAVVGIGEAVRLVTARGDRVVVNSPVYPPFYAAIRMAEREVADVPLVRTPDGGWELDLEGLDEAFAAGARAYVLCSPHNPVGRVWSPEALAGIATVAARHGAVVISDEIHAPLTLPGAEHAVFPMVAGEGGADSIVVTSASKAWNLPGMKCAVLVAGSPAMRARLRTIPPETRYRAGYFGVLGSVAAFRDGDAWLADAIAQLDRNRALLDELLRAKLPAIGYRPPQATYLAWLDCGALGLADPAKTFLEKGRVALNPGTPFGGVGGAFVRLNMATSAAILEEIVERMARALA